MKNLFFRIGFVFSVLFLFPSITNAQFSLSPIRYDVSLKPGESIEKEIQIVNQGPTTTVGFLVQDFKASNDSGSPVLMSKEESAQLTSRLSNWVTFPQSLRLEGDDRAYMKFTIDIPADAEPGGYYSSLFLEKSSNPTGGGSAIGTVTRIGALLFVRVEGDVKEDADVKDFSVPESGVAENGVTFNVKLENTGNVHMKPVGTLYINDEDGNTVEGIGKAPIFNAFGQVDRMVDVDYIRFNHHDSLVLLPGQSRDIEAVWEKEDDSEGNFTAYASITFGEGENNKTIKTEEIAFSIIKKLLGTIETNGSMFFNPPIDFDIIVENAGNLKFDDQVFRIDIYNIVGAKVGSIDLELGEQLEVEDEEGKKQTVTRIAASKTYETDASYNESRFFGPYTASLVWVDGGREKELDSTSYIAGSIMSLIITIVIIIIILVGGTTMIRNYRKMQKVLAQSEQRAAEQNTSNENE
jgi:hypothetical protein